MKTWWYVVVGVVVVLGLLGWGGWKLCRSRTWQVMGEFYPRVNTTENVVALTFDDGPTAQTDTVLALLRRLDVKATFFLMGVDLERHPTEGPKLVAAGHQLGNHTYSHPVMIGKSQAFIRREIETTDSLIRQVGYRGDILFRPPFGKRLFGLPFYLRQTHRKTILWDVEPESFDTVARNSAAITQHVLAHTRPGSIILLHVMYKGDASIAAIRGIVTGLRQRGYQFKTVSELLTYQRPPASARINRINSLPIGWLGKTQSLLQ